MRKVLLLLLLAAAPALVLPGAPAGASSPSASEQELLVIKKKKAEAARKAAAAKKKAALQKSVKATGKTKARLIASQKPAAAKPRAIENSRSVSRRSCSGLLGCLFGNKTRPGVQRASTARMASDYATAEVVDWAAATKYQPGSIVVRTPERALYLVLGDGQARRYKVGVGREGFQWSGNSKIVAKQEWPTWRPPQAMIEREAEKGHFLPEVMEGGPENPLGARAMYIGGTLYRIHGTNNAASIGGAVSSGCIRMMNTDVVDLYERVKVGARVYVYQ